MKEPYEVQISTLQTKTSLGACRKCLCCLPGLSGSPATSSTYRRTSHGESPPGKCTPPLVRCVQQSVTSNCFTPGLKPTCFTNLPTTDFALIPSGLLIIDYIRVVTVWNLDLPRKTGLFLFFIVAAWYEETISFTVFVSFFVIFQLRFRA